MTSSISGPVPISVTGTFSLSSIFFIKDLALLSKSLMDFTPAHSGNLTSNFVMAICVAELSIIALSAKAKLDVRFPECAGVKSISELDNKAKSFIKNIEDKLKVPVTLIGTGPLIDDVIDLRT